MQPFKFKNYTHPHLALSLFINNENTTKCESRDFILISREYYINLVAIVKGTSSSNTISISGS